MASRPGMAARAAPGFMKLTRQHAVRISPAVGVSVEDCNLAIGAVVGYDRFKSASRMNGAVVVFLDCTDKVSRLVESGIVVQGSLVPVLPLANPAKKVLVSNVPPFLRNELIEKELARCGQVMSPLKMIPLGCKSPHLKHVMSFRRQSLMILKKDCEDLNVALCFHITTDTLRCVGCGAEGHLVRSCPERTAGSQAAEEPPRAEGQPAAQRDTHSEPQTKHNDTGNTQSKTQSTQDDIQTVTQRGEHGAVKSTFSVQKEVDRAQSPPERPRGQTEVQEHTATRVAEAVLDEDSVMDEECLQVAVKRKNTETKASNVKAKKVCEKNPQLSSSQPG